MSRYEVLLRREGGLNKTVIIDDCMSEQEAMHTAESMYGMEALRATWRPKTNVQFGDSDNCDHQSNYSSGGSSLDSSSSLALLLLGSILVFGGMVLSFIVTHWPWFLGGFIVIFLLWLCSDD